MHLWVVTLKLGFQTLDSMLIIWSRQLRFYGPSMVVPSLELGVCISLSVVYEGLEKPRTHILFAICGINMWSAHGFVYINNKMIMICILPIRVKEQPPICDYSTVIVQSQGKIFARRRSSNVTTSIPLQVWSSECICFGRKV